MKTKTEHKVTKGQVRTALTALRRHCERRTTVSQIYNDLRLELESAGVYDLLETEVRGKLEQALSDITTLQTLGEQPVVALPGDADEEED